MSTFLILATVTLVLYVVFKKGRLHLKRKWLRMKIRMGRNLSKRNSMTSEQKKAVTITKRMILEKDSKLYCSAGSAYGENYKPRYIIRNGHIYIRITYDKIRIINGVFKYDVSFNDGDANLANVREFFAKNMEHRLDKLEAEINENVGKSLDIILDEMGESPKKIE